VIVERQNVRMRTPLISENVAASHLMFPLTLIVIPFSAIGRFFSSVHPSLDAVKKSANMCILEEIFRVIIGVFL
jgi:hypothetical protein